jgi:hypothetical protein
MKTTDIKTSQRSWKTTLAVLILGLYVNSTLAANVVVPSQFTSASGNDYDDAPLGTTNQHFQQVYSASLLSGLSIGDQITGIGFRTISNSVSLVSQTVPDYSIWMGTSALAPGSMSSTFANNRTLDFTNVLSGPLNIAPGQFPGGPGINNFGYITFTTPYTYTGGNLLIEIAYADFSGGGVSVDTAFPYNNLDPSLAQTAFGSGPSSTTADQGLYNEAIITSFMVTPIPEPTSLALFVIGMAGIPLVRSISKRRR